MEIIVCVLEIIPSGNPIRREGGSGRGTNLTLSQAAINRRGEGVEREQI
jgi:hypothetical protein